MKKYIKRISIFVILVIISLTTIFYVKADSGWDSDYGSSSSGSSWSSTSSNSSSSSSNTSDKIVLYFIIFNFILIIIGYLLYSYKEKKLYIRVYEVSNKQFKKYISGSKNNFKKNLFNTYLDIENCKSNFNYDRLLTLCTNDMYIKLKNKQKKLQDSNQRNIRNIIDSDLKIVRNIEEKNGMLYITFWLKFIVNDYIVDANNNLIEKNKNTLKCEFHSVIFIIKKDKIILYKDELFDNNNIYYPGLSVDEYNIYFDISKEELKNKINKHFIDVQKTWMNFDYDNLRKLCTDELYNQYKTQLETLKLKNEQNIMNDFTIKEVSIYDIKKVNKVIEISVYLDIKFRDYVINTKNNKVVRGSKNIYFDNGYELTFVMSNNNKITSCPSCGASVEVVASNVCPYCKNTIVQISNELVLSKKKIVSSRKTNS